MNTELIRMFGVALKGNEINATDLNFKALKLGYVVHPDCCTQDVYDFLSQEDIDYNSTFYKSWSDVTSKSRIELFVDQCIHYFMSYDHNIVVTANDGDRFSVPVYNDYKFIKPATKEELYNRCIEMLKSNIALKSDSVIALTDYIGEYVENSDIDFNIDEINNREAVAVLCNKLGIYPNDPHDLMRYILYSTTGTAIIIKNRDTLNSIYNSVNPFHFDKLNNEQLKALASVFYRYKDIILAFRHNYFENLVNGKKYKHITSNNKKTINKIRRMANKYHKPFTSGFWESVLDINRGYSEQYIRERIVKDNVSNFKLIQLIQCINDRLLIAAGYGDNMYLIRNGKSWVKKSNIGVIDIRINYWTDLKNIFENTLIDRLKEKACIIRFSDKLNIACPTSEKNFIGDIPIGSYFNINNYGFFGIYWKNEWGTHDFDLSFIGLDNNKIGWDSDFYDSSNNVIFSGDIVTAPNGASEVILIKKNCPDGIVYVNRYDGDPNSRYRFFMGIGDKRDGKFNYNEGYMVNPDHIEVKTDCISNKTEQTIGIIKNSKLYMMNIGLSNSIISKNSEQFNEAALRKLNTFLYVKDILLKAGFKDADNIDWNDPEYKGRKVELDLKSINRDTIINIFK